MEIRELSKKKFTQRTKSKKVISIKLENEIKATQKLLSNIYKKKYKKRRSFTVAQASDFIADVYKRQRYKMQNE